MYETIYDEMFRLKVLFMDMSEKVDYMLHSASNTDLLRKSIYNSNNTYESDLIDLKCFFDMSDDEVELLSEKLKKQIDFINRVENTFSEKRPRTDTTDEQPTRRRRM